MRDCFARAAWIGIRCVLIGWIDMLFDDNDPPDASNHRHDDAAHEQAHGSEGLGVRRPTPSGEHDPGDDERDHEQRAAIDDDEREGAAPVDALGLGVWRG